MIILKYTMPVEEEFSIYMPAYSKILKVDMQHSLPRLWALITPGFENIQYSFRLIGTGKEFHDIEDLQYIDTFQMLNGRLVWHLFQYMKSNGAERALSL